MSGVLRDLHVLTPSFPTRRSSDLLVIDHLCRNRACCNPAHMEAVTRAENLRRGVVAKLTPAQVNEIRALKGSGLTHREIGLRFDVSQRSEEHTSELQSLMRISYAVFCLEKKKTKNYNELSN